MKKKKSFVRINLLLSTKRKHFKWIWEPLHLRLIIHKGMAMEEMGSIVYNKSLCAETGRVVHVYYFHITFLNSLHFQKMHQSFRVLIMNYPKYIQSPGYFYVYKTIRNVRQKSVWHCEKRSSLGKTFVLSKYFLWFQILSAVGITFPILWSFCDAKEQTRHESTDSMFGCVVPFWRINTL